MTRAAKIQNPLPPGLYEKLVDSELSNLIKSHPELAATLEKVDDAQEPDILARFMAAVIRQALPGVPAHHRTNLINRLVDVLGSVDGLEYTARKKLLAAPHSVLREILPHKHASSNPAPETPLSISSLLTGAAEDPPLDREIRAEMRSADRIDMLISFIKWSGLALLRSAFEELEERQVPVRIITTSYMGASDPHAVEWLASRRNVLIKVSYDSERTRLHAKAYHFYRATGFSTAYIGSANMSRPAMTSGLEWTVKITETDMAHVLERFRAEFETYWTQPDFVVFSTAEAERFRDAVARGRGLATLAGSRFLPDIKPHPFQERILEAIAAARDGGSHRNLVVAATGTGKTVVSAFDYASYRRANPDHCRLLFVAHRREILQQSLDCFRAVLRDFNFGELFVDGLKPTKWSHVFASVSSLSQQRPWDSHGEDHFHFVVVDEAHHIAASSYRPIADHLKPRIILGLSATPERMDGTSILPDFDNRFAAEIRLPEALEEKLLCPFHYFGVSDPISTSDERFWKNGRYNTVELENVYTGDDMRATARLNAIFGALDRYQPDLTKTRGVGFCAGVKHAHYMAEAFKSRGITAEVVLGETPGIERDDRVARFRQGDLTFLFTVDVFSEGVDIPEINLVLFLRPTESLTVFLQQLGRGLRHAPEKDCLTVLDFVGQTHRKYRVDRKFSALLRRSRRRIDREILDNFPSLPPGCSIELERIAKEHILANIKNSLAALRTFVPEAIRTYPAETGQELSLGGFLDYTNISPTELFKSRTWSEWKDLAAGTDTVRDPHREDARSALRRISLRTDARLLCKVQSLCHLIAAEERSTYGITDQEAAAIHYLFWSTHGKGLKVKNHRESFTKWRENVSTAADIRELIDWRTSHQAYPIRPLDSDKYGFLQLHAAYGLREILAAFGLANLKTTGPTGTGVVHIQSRKTYLHLVTFRKSDRDFSPTTRYHDYPISPSLLHWESQSTIASNSKTATNYLNFIDRGYSILFFARLDKQIDGETSPFVFLGPASKLISCESERPLKMVWELEHQMPAALFEEARAV